MRLPLNCTVDYLSDFLSKDEASEVYRFLIEVYRIAGIGKLTFSDCHNLNSIIRLLPYSILQTHSSSDSDNVQPESDAYQG